MNSTDHSLERTARIASRHHGLITHADAKRAGLSDWQIFNTVERGRWERIVPGVYRVAGVPDSVELAALAACLVAGRDALTSVTTGLALLGVGMPPRVPHITVPPNCSARTRIAHVHRSLIQPIDRTRVGVIPTTTAARCLVDAASLVSHDDLCDLTDSSIHKRLASPSEVLGAIRRAGKGRRGIPSLLAALRPWLDGIRPGSPAEVRLLRRLDDWGIPPPQKQVPITHAGVTIATVDLGWPVHHVGLEYLGGLTHTPREEARDQARRARVEALGWWIGEVDRGDLRPSNTRLRDELRPRLRWVA
jgi:hypothetical protein